MLNQMTLNRLHEMKLNAMAEKYRTIAASAAEGQLSFDEWFGLLVDAEWDHRHTNRIARLMKKATAAHSASRVLQVQSALISQFIITFLV